MSFEAAAWAMRVRGVKPAQRLVLVALAQHLGTDGRIFPGINEIAEQLKVSRRTVQACLDQLQAKGLVRRESTFRKDGSQTSNSYFLPQEAIDWRAKTGGAKTAPPRAESAPPPGAETSPPGAESAPLTRNQSEEPKRELPEGSSTSRHRPAKPADDAPDVALWIPVVGKPPTKPNAFLAPYRRVVDTEALGSEHGWANGGNEANEYGVRETEIFELARAYPAVDVRVRLVALREWSRKQPARRKTYQRMSAWLSDRLAADQNKGQATVPFAGRDQRSPEEIRRGLFQRIDTIERLGGVEYRSFCDGSRDTVMKAPAFKQKLLDYELRLDETIAQLRRELPQAATG